MSSALAALAGRRSLLAVSFLISLAMVGAQVTVTRLLAYQFFYHFVFLVISLAQLGLAGAGAWVYAVRRRAWSVETLRFWLLLAAVIPLVLLLYYALAAPPRNISHAKVIGAEGYPYLTTLAVLLVLFNLAGGMGLTLLFTQFKERIGRLYAADLVGAAAGCLVSVGAMAWLGPIRALLVSSVAAGLAALAVPTESGAPNGLAARLRRAAPTAAVLALVAAAFVGHGFFDPVAHNPEVATRVIRSEWNHLARVDAEEPGLYVIDGDASTRLYGWGRVPDAPEYMLTPDAPSVAIIGVGAGAQLRDALRHEPRSVLAVDINPVILEWDLVDDRAFNQDIFHDPRVTVVAGEGRHAVRSSTDRFDLIVMHAIDTWTASSQGAYSLTENFLYTREAFQDYLGKLEPDGVMSIRRWLFWPPRENLRLFTTILAALEDAGYAHPERHVVVLSPDRDYEREDLKTWGYVFLSKSELDEGRLAHLDVFAERARWAFLYRPGADHGTPFDAYVAAADREQFLRDYEYVVEPATDDNPFFFQFSPPWSSFEDALSGAIYGTSSSVLVVCLAMTVALTILILGVPLFLRRKDLRGDRQLGTALVYFACLGFGFMAFELPTIQAMTLFLGHPTYALSVVLMGLLASAGAGSALMGRLPLGAGRVALIVVVLLGLAGATLLLPAVHALIGAPPWARFTLTLLVVACLGVPLGMPFVAGVRLLDPARPHQIAWAWAVNGATAVVGTTALMIVMVYLGSTASFVLAVAAYAGALAIRGALSRGRGSPTLEALHREGDEDLAEGEREEGDVDAGAVGAPLGGDAG